MLQLVSESRSYFIKHKLLFWMRQATKRTTYIAYMAVKVDSSEFGLIYDLIVIFALLIHKSFLCLKLMSW